MIGMVKGQLGIFPYLRLHLAFRQCSQELTLKINDYILEPVGGASPKFSQETKTLSFVKPTESVMSLMCAAQGFPVPTFRLVCF